MWRLSETQVPTMITVDKLRAGDRVLAWDHDEERSVGDEIIYMLHRNELEVIDFVRVTHISESSVNGSDVSIRATSLHNFLLHDGTMLPAAFLLPGMCLALATQVGTYALHDDHSIYHMLLLFSRVQVRWRIRHQHDLIDGLVSLSPLPCTYIFSKY